MSNNFVIAFFPQPKNAGSTLESWNLLSSMKALNDGVDDKQSKTLLIYTSGSDRNLENVVNYANEIGYKKVLLYANLEDVEVKKDDYVKLIEDRYLSEIKKFDENSILIDKIFWIMGTIEPGVQQYTKNTVHIQELLQKGYSEKSDTYSGDYIEHFIYQSLLNQFSSFNMPMIHQLIVDPVEADVSIYLHEFLHSAIRRHFVHPLINRPSVYANPFIVLPFFDIHCAFSNSDSNSKKSIDFVFGLTGYDDIRKRFIQDLKEILVDKNHFYYCYKDDSGKMIDTRLSYENYLMELLKSKTTLLIPAYDVETFSVHRFVEAISMNCLPIIYEANYVFGFLGYTDTIKFIEEHLVIDEILEINSKIDEVASKHSEILSGLLKTSYFQMLIKNESTRLFY